MIPVSSFRKGIKVKVLGEVATLKSFTEEEVIFEDHAPCKPEEVAPIPLSPYWLHYFQFVDDGFQKEPEKWVGYQENRGFVYFLNGHNKGKLLTQKGIPLTLYPIMYVHQFQNALYYFLGREADYKIPAKGEKVWENGEYVRDPI